MAYKIWCWNLLINIYILHTLFYQSDLIGSRTGIFNWISLDCRSKYQHCFGAPLLVLIVVIKISRSYLDGLPVDSRLDSGFGIHIRILILMYQGTIASKYPHNNWKTLRAEVRFWCDKEKWTKKLQCRVACPCKSSCKDSESDVS